MSSATKERKGTQAVDLSAICTSGRTLARERIDHEFVEAYAQAYRDEESLPPVTLYFDGQTHWVGDGHHRIAAARSLDWHQIDAVVHEGGEREAILHAVGANDQHGNRRSIADKRLAVTMLLEDPEWSKWPDRQLAKAARVSHTFVADMRERLATLPVEAPPERPEPRKRIKPEVEPPAQDWQPSDADDEPESEPAPRPAQPPEPQSPLTQAFEAVTDVAREILQAVPREELHLVAEHFRAMADWLGEMQAAKTN